MAKIVFLRGKWRQKRVFFKLFYPQLWKTGTKLFLKGKTGLSYQRKKVPVCAETLCCIGAENFVNLLF